MLYVSRSVFYVFNCVLLWLTFAHHRFCSLTKNIYTRISHHRDFIKIFIDNIGKNKIAFSNLKKAIKIINKLPTLPFINLS